METEFLVRDLDTGQVGNMSESKYAPDVGYLSAKAEAPVRFPGP